MAIAFDADLGTAFDSTPDPGTDVVLTTTAAAASGSRIILVVSGFYDSGTESVSASGGGLTWVLDGTANGVSPIATGYRLWILSAAAPSGLASGTAITVAMGGNYYSRGVAAASFTGIATASYTDGSNSGSDNTPSGGWATGTVTTTNADDLLMCGWQADIASAFTNTPTGSFNEIHDTLLNYWHIGSQYRIVSATDTYSASGTSSVNASLLALLVAYKADAGGPPQTLRPDADIVTTGWATAPLWSKIDEASPDGTVITATAS